MEAPSVPFSSKTCDPPVIGKKYTITHTATQYYACNMMQDTPQINTVHTQNPFVYGTAAISGRSEVESGTTEA